MTDYKERRNYPRVAVDGAIVAYKKKERFELLIRFSSFFPLRDLAKGGICFELDTQINRGTKVEVKLAVPGEKRISVKGTIVWSTNITGNGRMFAGVQFLPFGKGSQYNSFECWEKLEQIISQHYNNENVN